MKIYDFSCGTKERIPGDKPWPVMKPLLEKLEIIDYLRLSDMTLKDFYKPSEDVQTYMFYRSKEDCLCFCAPPYTYCGTNHWPWKFILTKEQEEILVEIGVLVDTRKGETLNV